MKKNILLLTVMFIFFLIPLSAQKISFSGKVFSEKDKLPLLAANAVLRGENGNVVAAEITGSDGKFIISNISPMKDYRLEVSYMGYKTFSREYKNVRSDIRTGSISLQEEAKSLEELSIVGKEPLAVMKGDTMQYNSSAYKTNPDATAEDLAKKMPGIEISGNSVKAQGEDVKKVTVDGKPFFDQDASLTLRTLPASMVDKIEIFDEQSEQAKFTGFDDGNTSKTMNIVTHSRMRNGTFGRFYGGVGPDGFYQAGASYNIFKGSRRISLLGMANNVNVQNFSSEDIIGISSGSGGGGGRGGQGGGNNFSTGAQSGLSTTNALGLNYSDVWGSKVNVTGSYFFNNKGNSDTRNLQQDYFSVDSSKKAYRESEVSSSENYNHRLNMRIDYAIDSSNKIFFQPRLSFQRNNSWSENSAKNLLNGLILNSSDSRIHSEQSGYNFSNDFLYSHAFRKKGRTLSLSLNGGISNSGGSTWQNSMTEIFRNEIISDSIDNFTDRLVENNSISSRLSWTEPIGEKSSVIVNFGKSIRWNDSDKQTFDSDPFSGEYNRRDSVLSNVFKSRYESSTAGLGYRLGKGKLIMISFLDYEHSILSADRIFPMESTLDKSYNSVLPSSMLRYDFSKTMKLRLYYRTNTSSPSVTQLQDVLDTRNPLQITAGNPLLRPSYQQNLFMRFSRTNPDKASTAFFLLGGGLTNDYVANSIYFATVDTILPGNIKLSKGSRLSRPVNIDGYRNVRSFVNYGIPITALKTNLNFNLSWSYSRIPGLLNGQEGFSDNAVSGLGVVLSSNISEKIDFNISSMMTYNHTKSTLEENSVNDYINQRSGLHANITFWQGIVFSSDISHQYYSGLSSEFSSNYLLWNLGLAKKFFSDQSGELKLSVYDLLKQNSSYSRTVTESYIQDSQNQVLGQYFMLTFTWKLKSFSGVEPNRERMMRPGMDYRPGEGGPPHGDGPPPGMGSGIGPESF